MHIVTQLGDLSEATSMSREGQIPSEHESVVTSVPSLNTQEGNKEVKKSAFEITSVVDENEDLESSQIAHNKTIGEDDDNPGSPTLLAASTPSKLPNKDTIHSTSILPVASIATTTYFNGSSHPHAPGSGFRKVKDYVRERWKVSDSCEVDEHSDTSEPRGAAVQKLIEIPSNASSPSAPRRNTSIDIASSSNLSDGKSDVQWDEAARQEGVPLTDISSTVTSRRASTEYSQDELLSTDDNYESYSQGVPSETNVKNETETANVEISNITRGVESIKSEASKIQSFITNIEAVMNENAKLKQTVESLRKQNDKLERDLQQLRDSVAHQTPSSTVPS